MNLITAPLADLFFLAQHEAHSATDKAGLFSFLKSLDEDILAPVMILGTIFFFITLVVSVITIFGTYQNVTTAKLKTKLIYELVEKGYQANDIAKIVHGDSNGYRWFQKKNSQPESFYGNRPMPPVKSV